MEVTKYSDEKKNQTKKERKKERKNGYVAY